MTDLLGAILVGGQSRRFGEPKESAPLGDGDAFEDRVRRALLPVTESLIRIGAPDDVGGVPGVPDHRPGMGPLGGIEAGLAHASERGMTGLVVLAVDLVRLSAPAVLRLVREWRSLPDPAGSVVLGEGPDGRQPLAAVYGTRLAGDLSAWLDAEAGRSEPELSVRRWLAALEGAGHPIISVPESDLNAAAGHPDTLLNVNSRADLDAGSAPTAPPIVAVQGWKNSGKTTVSTLLIEALAARGLRVMALKRGHGFNLDHPGTDSSRMTRAGARRVLLAGPDSMAMMGEWGAGGEQSLTALAMQYLPDAEVVVAEGWKNEGVPAVEVTLTTARDHDPLWRPDAVDRDRFLAVVSDHPADRGEAGTRSCPPMFHANDADLGERLADLVESRVLGRRVVRTTAG